jgi:hypothetical protein
MAEVAPHMSAELTIFKDPAWVRQIHLARASLSASSSAQEFTPLEIDIGGKMNPCSGF